MIYTSQKVIKLNTKKPQLWFRNFYIDGYWAEYIVYPNGKVYRFNSWSGKWDLNKSFETDRYDLEKYGEFITYV